MGNLACYSSVLKNNSDLMRNDRKTPSILCNGRAFSMFLLFSNIAKKWNSSNKSILHFRLGIFLIIDMQISESGTDVYKIRLRLATCRNSQTRHSKVHSLFGMWHGWIERSAKMFYDFQLSTGDNKQSKIGETHRIRNVFLQFSLALLCWFCFDFQ